MTWVLLENSGGGPVHVCRVGSLRFCLLGGEGRFGFGLFWRGVVWVLGGGDRAVWGAYHCSANLVMGLRLRRRPLNIGVCSV